MPAGQYTVSVALAAYGSDVSVHFDVNSDAGLLSGGGYGATVTADGLSHVTRYLVTVPSCTTGVEFRVQYISGGELYVGATGVALD